MSMQQTIPPASTKSTYTQGTIITNDIWRDGKLIVLKKGALLPGRCLRTNAPVAGRRKKVTLYWHSPWLFTLILVHVFVFIIVAMCARKSVTLEIAMSSEMIRRRNRLFLIGGVLAVSGIIEFILGVMHEGGDLFQILLGMTAFFAGIVVAAVGGQTLTVQRIEGDYIWLRGASPEYLNGFSEWRGIPRP